MSNLVQEPLLYQRDQHLISLARIEQALKQCEPRPSRLTRESLISLHFMIREEVRRLEDAFRGQGPGPN